MIPEEKKLPKFKKKDKTSISWQRKYSVHKYENKFHLIFNQIDLE